MAITAFDLHQLATWLHASESEVAQRAGVSRNYYAAFHAATHWLNKTPGLHLVGSKVGGVHAQLQSRLCNLDRGVTDAQRRKGRLLASKLQEMKVRRVTADYKLLETLSKREIAAQREHAATFLIECEVLSQVAEPSAHTSPSRRTQNR